MRLTLDLNTRSTPIQTANLGSLRADFAWMRRLPDGVRNTVRKWRAKNEPNRSVRRSGNLRLGSTGENRTCRRSGASPDGRNTPYDRPNIVNALTCDTFATPAHFSPLIHPNAPDFTQVRLFWSINPQIDADHRVRCRNGNFSSRSAKKYLSDAIDVAQISPYV